MCIYSFIDVLLDNSMSTMDKVEHFILDDEINCFEDVFNNSIPSKQYATESTKLTSTKYIYADLNCD